LAWIVVPPHGDQLLVISITYMFKSNLFTALCVIIG
jgi:hypothetical protein